MRVCFVNSEIYNFTGFSRLNRIVGRELVKRGIEVYVLVPQTKGQRKLEQLDGMTILGFPYPSLKMLYSQSFFQLPEADIYEIWNPYLIFSYFIMRATPESKHIIVFLDPRDKEDTRRFLAADPQMREIRKMYNLGRIPYFVHYPYVMYLRPYVAQKTVSKGDTYFYEAKFLLPKVQKMHHLKNELIYMPQIADIFEQKPTKSLQPTVCFVAHWGVKKRPELFFDLARQFPQVQFIALGCAMDAERDKELREIGSGIPNLEMTGVVSEERKREILEKSWVLVNTAPIEGMPQSFIEACACRCALLSAVNPDDFAQNFGYRVQDDDFKSGLEHLLENNRWQEAGERGFEYVRENNDLNKVIERRIQVYESLLEKR